MSNITKPEGWRTPVGKKSSHYTLAAADAPICGNGVVGDGLYAGPLGEKLPRF